MSGAAARTGDLEIYRTEEYYKNGGNGFCKKVAKQENNKSDIENYRI